VKHINAFLQRCYAATWCNCCDLCFTQLHYAQVKTSL